MIKANVITIRSNVPLILSLVKLFLGLRISDLTFINTHNLLLKDTLIAIRSILGKTYSTTMNDRNVSRNGKYSLSYRQTTVKCVLLRLCLIPLNVATGSRVLTHPKTQAKKINLRTCSRDAKCSWNSL